MLFTLRETKQTAPAAVGETNLSVFPPINNVCASAENQVFAEIDGKFQPCIFHPHGSQIRLTVAWCNSATQTVLFLQMESQNSLGFIWKTHQETALSLCLASCKYMTPITCTTQEITREAITERTEQYVLWKIFYVLEKKYLFIPQEFKSA